MMFIRSCLNLSPCSKGPVPVVPTERSDEGYRTAGCKARIFKTANKTNTAIWNRKKRKHAAAAGTHTAADVQ